MSIEIALKRMVASKEPGAIVLQGRWGVGKTYFWRQQIIRPALTELSDTRYSYVSLFGINSLAELKTALAFATDEFDREARVRHRRQGKFSWLWKAKNWTFKWFWKSTGWLPDALTSTPKVGASVVKIYERAAFFLVRKRIICFDDIERHGRNLDVKDFLGLVSYLVDQRACRVVVILNSEELGTDQATWNAMREKVFDGELTYQPSIAETVSLGLSEVQKEPWHAVIRSSLETLGVSNIRLIRRVASFMRRAFEVCPAGEIRPETVEHMAKALAILVYSVHGQGEGAPPVAMVMQSGLYSPLIAYMREEDNQTEQEKRWSKLLENYPLSLHETLDRALLGMVQAGYPDSDALCSAISEFEADAGLRSKRNAWEKAWRWYHDTIADNGQKIVEAFEQAWPGVSEVENAVNLQSLAGLLRLLDRGDLATRYIREWVAQRDGERLRELDLDEMSSFRRIDDQEILETAAKVRKAADYNLTLQEAFDTVKNDLARYDDRAIAAFSRASPQEIVQMIEANPGHDLQSVIKKILNLPKNSSQSSWHQAGNNMQMACEIVAARSPLNADRMSNWVNIKAGIGALNPEI